MDTEYIDISQIDPEALDLGTELQDSSLIAQVFERGAHSTYTEASVFAVMSRSLVTSKGSSDSIKSSLSLYFRHPEENNASVGTTSSDQETLLGLSFEGSTVPVSQGAFGKTLLEFTKDCIPCVDRILALAELRPHVDFLGALELALKGRLDFLSGLGDLLNNIGVYTDLCSLLDLLNFMCIPDLQKLIALFSALLANQTINLDLSVNLLQSLVAPIFAPLLTSIVSLLDQFVLMVTSPLDCILDLIKEQQRHLKAMQRPGITDTVQGGLIVLEETITEGRDYIKNKLAFYVDQLNALFGELSSGDGTYLKIAFKKLTLIRLIGFISSVISAMAQGVSLCASGAKPDELSELDNFFNTYLNPNSSFAVTLDKSGNIHVFDKFLSNQPNMIQSEGSDVVDPALAEEIRSTSQSLNTTVDIQVPCKLKTTSVDEANKVNQWIAELNQV